MSLCLGFQVVGLKGDTEEEALENIRDAIREYLAAVAEMHHEQETREIEVIV